MANMVFICEACRRRRVTEVIGNDDPYAPYRVCAECSKRLQQLTLRPLEWFNLAAKHGWQKYLLHDDFYNQDGTKESYCAADMRAPTLDEASRSLERLVDYCITRWNLDAAEYDAFRMFAGESILSELSRRASSGNRHVTHVTLTLCANVLGYIAEPWVRAQYERACEDDMLFSWAEAAAHCLPQPEGVNKTEPCANTPAKTSADAKRRCRGSARRRFWIGSRAMRHART